MIRYVFDLANSRGYWDGHELSHFIIRMAINVILNMAQTHLSMQTSLASHTRESIQEQSPDLLYYNVDHHQ
jgi:hypothetical protein